MPLKVERHLEAEAHEKGFKKGSRRYNAYVYGTMNKLGILSHNHAGNLGPDKLLKHADYKPTFANVKGIHIAVIAAIGLLLYVHFFGGFNFGTPYSNSGRVNGDGANNYVDTQSFAGWIANQYNSLGANAGALNGESN